MCANGGTCNANGTCDCPPGFGGYRCSMKLCTSKHPGHAMLTHIRIVWFCMTLCFGFFGCLSLGDPECQNGGLCSNGVCFCPLPYTGSTCGECKFWSCAISLVKRHCLVWLLLPCAAPGLVDLQIPGLPNICQFNYCLNSGSCVEDTIRNTSYCDCPDGYEGANCESATCKSVIWSIGYM